MITINSDNLEYKQIRKCKIPTIGLGTHKLKGNECTDATLDALEIGYRHIDTAQKYENEKDVGKGIEMSGLDREDIFITDKIWFENLKPDDLKKTFYESLNKLRTTYVDLLLIHWPSPEDVSLMETLGAMRDLVKEETVRWLGVSNFNPTRYRKALGLEDVIANQVEYHPFLAQEEILELCNAHSNFLIAYSPLAQGNIKRTNTLLNLSKKYGKTEAQITLRWLIQQHGVVAIPKASSAQHRRENIDVFDFELEETEMNGLIGMV
jgi:diketogulonate reductase-like aldo/keto reductase